MRARQPDLRPACAFGDLGQQAADALPDPVAVIGQLIFGRQDAFGFFAEGNSDGVAAVVHRLHGAGG